MTSAIPSVFQLDMVPSVGAVGLAPIAHGATDDQKCAAKKIKAAGKKVFDKARCHQKATLHGTSVDQECLDKAEDKFNLQIAKADVLGTCAGTASGIEADVDACVATLVGDVLPPPTETDCNNSVDDDLDTFVDCFDSDCAGNAECGAEFVCDDGLDNDADGAVDCDDSDCPADDPNLCPPPAETDCMNNVDDDLDGAVDCFDSDCTAAPECGMEMVCDDGLDNDADGATDCADPDCGCAP